MPRAAEESRATLAGKWLLAVVIVVSAQALGSIPTEILVVMSGLAAVACALLWAKADVETSRATRLVLIALALLLGMTILQAVPLPSAVTHSLTPANADSWDRALAPLREPTPAWHSLSLAPAATRVEVLRGFFYGCVFLSALRVSTHDGGDAFLVRLVVLSTSVMALSALAHIALGAERVFGVYRPHELYAYRAGHLAPLLNLNHLAAYLNIGACVAIGALVDGRAIPRPLAASAGLVLAGTSVWQGSRGATASLFVGIILTIVLSLYTKRRQERSRRNAAVIAASAAAAVFVVSIALSDLAGRLVSTDYVKVDVAWKSMRLVAASPWFGAGRGAFETVFSSVRGGAVYATFTHPENCVAQWFVEWGVPVSVAGAALLARALRPQVVLRAVHPPIGAWVAILVAVAHDLVDFHLEVPGVVAIVAVCVAVVISARPSSSSSESPSSSSRSRRPAPRTMRIAAIAVVAGTALATAWSLRDVGHSLAEDRRALSAMAVDKAVSGPDFRESLRSAMLRYPHEPFFPLMGSVRAQLADDGTVVAWVSRALELDPRFGRAHFVLARDLAKGHAAQARLEYRLAFENDVRLRDQIAKEGARLVVDVDTALEMVPDGEEGVGLLELFLVAVAPRLPATAVRLDDEIERRSPNAVGPVRRRINGALADAKAGAPWCADKRCIADGLRDAELFASREPTMCEPHALVADLLVEDGDAKRAADGLEHAIDNVSDRAMCQRDLITLALRTGQTRRGDAALEQLVRGGCGATTECVDLYTWAAGMEESRGRYALAVRLYKQVLEIEPERDDLLEHIGTMGSGHGVLADSVEAYNILATRHPDDPRWPAKVKELRAGALPRPPAPSPD